MDFHPVANIFPMMSEEEYEKLKDDIYINGQREPIWTYKGQIVDGRNRYNACMDNGLEPIMKEWDGRGSLLEFVMSLNMHRRHLTASQKAVVALGVEKIQAEEARERLVELGKFHREKQLVNSIPSGVPAILPEPQMETGDARDKAAEVVGVSARYISDAKRIERDAPELIEPLLEGKINIPLAKILVEFSPEEREEIIVQSEKQIDNSYKAIKEVAYNKKREKEENERLAEIAKIPLPKNITDRYKIYHCGVAELIDRVEPNSVDWIITDPPYPKEFLNTYADLAKFAKHALKDGGSLLAMAGQSYLPDIYAMLGEELAYHWTLAYTTAGGQSPQIWPRKVNAFWKPVLWYTKGEYTGKWIGDVAKSEVNDNDKNFHHWGQSESGFYSLSSKFVQRGDTVCDPFLGGGTTAVVALELGAYFVGCDIDQLEVEKTLRRIQNGTAS